MATGGVALARTDHDGGRAGGESAARHRRAGGAAMGRAIPLSAALHPLQPVWTESGPWIVQSLQLTMWINWLLLLANLLPAYPFDGGGLLTQLLRLARPAWHPQRIAAVVFRTAVVCSGLMLVAALVLLKHQADAIFPSSFACFALSVVLLVGARRDLDSAQQRWPTADASHAAGAGETVVVAVRTLLPDTASAALQDEQFERDQVVDHLDDADEDDADEDDVDDEDVDDEDEDQFDETPSSTYWAATAEEQSAAAAEAEEEQLVDAVLSRLHEHGWASLTSDERALLKRTSAHYRHRRGQATRRQR